MIEGDLALEGEQLGAGRALDGAAGCGDGAGRLEEVRRVSGATSALFGAGGVAEVDRDDLAGAGDRIAVTDGASLALVRRPLLCVVFEIVYHRSHRVGKQSRSSGLIRSARQPRQRRHEQRRHLNERAVTTGFTPTGTIASSRRPATGRVRDRGRHHRRVVRLLHLRHGRRPGLRPAVLRRRSARTARSLAFATVGVSFLFRPLGAFLAGHFGDKLRPQGRADVDADPDGRRDRAHRRAAHLRGHRRLARRSCSCCCASCRASRPAASGAARS